MSHCANCKSPANLHRIHIVHDAEYSLILIEYEDVCNFYIKPMNLLVQGWIVYCNKCAETLANDAQYLGESKYNDFIDKYPRTIWIIVMTMFTIMTDLPVEDSYCSMDSCLLKELFGLDQDVVFYFNWKMPELIFRDITILFRELLSFSK